MVPESTADFLRRLRDRLAGRDPASIVEEGARHASVAVVVSGDAEPAILFVKRLERDADPWSGHAAFPGGFRSDPAETAVATAERETEEETSLDLKTTGTLLGRLDDVYPRSIHLPKVIVSPCVFVLPSRLPVRAAGEIDRALWIPVSEVFDPANRRSFSVSLPTGPRDFEAIHVSGLVIWGLTERILHQIVTLIQ